MSGGVRAVTSGALFERQVGDALATWLRLPAPVNYKDWIRQGSPRPALVRHYPYTSIYGGNRSRSEFAVVLFDGHVIRVECKWQNSSGSVDEKFPYVLENAVAVPEAEILIVLGGDGARAAAVDWLVREASVRAKAANKSIRVFRDSGALNSWAQNNADRVLDSHLEDPFG